MVVAAHAVLVAAIVIGIIAVIRKYRPHWPSFIIAVAVTAIGAALLGLPIETIGTRFGGIPQSIPMPHLPVMSYAKVIDVLPNALSFALLGCIERVLSR
ncbi:hypothetical protein [Mesorhizobium sp. A623]